MHISFLTDHLLLQYIKCLLLHLKIFDNVPKILRKKIFLSIKTKKQIINLYFNNKTSINKFNIIPIPSILIKKIFHFNHHSSKKILIKKKRYLKFYFDPLTATPSHDDIGIRTISNVRYLLSSSLIALTSDNKGNKLKIFS